MITKTVEVTQVIEVTVDETKFTPEFLAEFSSYMFPFEDVDEHIKHLAQMHARGLADYPSTFIEGYGEAKDMGIKFKVVEQREEIEEP
ncbi:hypothetical protein [Endothiovibrio diazotrophicus]